MRSRRKILASLLSLTLLITSLPTTILANQVESETSIVQNLEEHNDNHYVIKNKGYNANIALGQTIRLGFGGNPGNVKEKPTNYVLNQVGIKNKTVEIIFNTEQLDYNEEEEKYIAYEKLNHLTGTIIGDADITAISYSIVADNLLVKSGDIAPQKNWSIDDFCMFFGENRITLKVKDKYNNVTSKTLEIFNLSVDNMDGIVLDENDDNGDGLLNYLELYYGTDKDNPDTDGDGLKDFEELVITMTDPLKVDTDDNGISDADEDFDHDGVKNIENNACFDKNEEGQINGNLNINTLEELSSTTKESTDKDIHNLVSMFSSEQNIEPLKYIIMLTDGDGVLDGEEVSVVVDEKNNVHHCSDIKVGDTLDKLSNRTKELVDKGFFDTASVSEMKGWKLIDYYRKRENDLEAEKVIASLLKKYSYCMNKVYITGHSRGGFLTQRAGSGIAANKELKNIINYQLEDFKMEDFNGMGVIFSKYAKDPIKSAELLGKFTALESINSKIVERRVDKNLVSKLGCHVVNQKIYTITDISKNNIDGNTIAAHSMSNFTYHIMPRRYKNQ